MKDDLQELLWTVRTLAENYSEVPSAIVLELLDTLDKEEDRDGLAKVTATVSETEPLAKETIMHEPTEVFSVEIYGHDIHGVMVDVFSNWSKESVKFPVSHLSALVATLSDLSEHYA